MSGALLAPIVKQVAVEAQNAETVIVNPSHESYEAERREQKLVLEFKKYLEGKERKVVRYLIQPVGEAKPIYADLYDKTLQNLVEAKGTATREAVRMIVGQLADYSRFLSPKPALAALLPERPRADLEALLRSQDIFAVWRAGSGFEDNANGRFV